MEAPDRPTRVSVAQTSAFAQKFACFIWPRLAERGRKHCDLDV